MIRWCAYCQNYLGEAAPFDQFHISHGICPKCLESGIAEEKNASDRLLPLTNFLTSLRREAREGITSDPKDWAHKAFELGIKPDSLLVGLIQPALYEIGELWRKGEVSVATEHRFSAFAEELIYVIYQNYPGISANRRAGQADVLLTNADGNHHTLGVKFMEIGLLAAGLNVLTLLPGLPTAEIIKQAALLKPKSLGLSVSMPSQIELIKELSEAVAGMPENTRPLLLAGGRLVKEGLVLPPEYGVICCPTISDFPFARLRAGRV